MTAYPTCGDSYFTGMLQLGYNLTELGKMNLFCDMIHYVDEILIKNIKSLSFKFKYNLKNSTEINIRKRRK